MIGTTVGHYSIVDQLGQGGMGVVYLAEDRKLKRRVALKALPPALAQDPGCLQRFQREAEALAVLDHPGIVTVFSIESAPLPDADSTSDTTMFHFLTMQLIEGRSLVDLIPPDGFAVDEFFGIAIQLADALAAAHDKGVIHRDLKPSNIMVTANGQVKVLDFGLAKLRWDATIADSSELPTEALTQAGNVVGTVPYMSPEQVQGRDLDLRSDIFSLGAVLYEMALGQRPFSGESPADLMSAILRDTPTSIDTLRTDLPHHLARIVRHCLERDPRNRFQTARDVCNELQDLRAELGSTDTAGSLARSVAKRQAEIRSLAVLPLVNLSGESDQEYFADGMTEALITDLARIGGLKVISRTSVMLYKDARKPLREIARELDVAAIIEGSVLRIGDSVRISAQLIDAQTDEHLWAESYDRHVRDILTLMSEVARNVADEVCVQLTSQERSLLAGRRQVDPEAHELFLKGRFHLGRLTREGVEQAADLMQRAIDRDPDYPQAWVGLADARLTFVLFGWLDYAEGLPSVRAAAIRALELDSTLADAHAILADVDARERNYEIAERGFRRAVELSPNHARAHGDYSMLLVWLARLDQAIAQAQRALELEPLSLKAGIDLGSAFYFARRYEEAEHQIRQVLALHPKAPYAEWCLGVTLAQQARYAEAIEIFLGRHVPTAATNWALGYIYGIVGEHDKAREVLDYLLEKSRSQFVSPAMIAYVYLGLGDSDRALDLLEETFIGRGGRLIYLQVDPWLDSLRDHPRFQELVRKMKFPPST